MQDRKGLDPERIATVRRRIGFVAVLWWISAVAGTLGLLEGLHAGRGRIALICVAWLLSAIFSFAWWSLRTEQPRK
jgi:hypothetical protein